jgi:hypothetical protein
MRRITVSSLSALCTVGALLSACVGPVPNERVDWGHGASYGRVLELLTPQAAAAHVQACLGSVPAPAGAAYAMIRYRRTRLHHNIVAVVPDGLALRVGDEVELWPEDCAQHRPAQVGRVLPPLPVQP